MPTAAESPCPVCSARNTLKITMRLVANPVGSFSIAGAQTKFTARELPVLDCRACGLHLVGDIADGHAVFQPPDADQTTEPSTDPQSPADPPSAP